MTENKRFWSEDYCVGYYTEIVDNDKELADVPNPKKNLTIKELVDMLNELHEENEYYKSIFFELVETALTDKNCRELYCKGILDIFDKANSLNQARDIIKEHLK